VGSPQGVGVGGDAIEAPTQGSGTCGEPYCAGGTFLQGMCSHSRAPHMHSLTKHPRRQWCGSVAEFGSCSLGCTAARHMGVVWSGGRVLVGTRGGGAMM
jgi:hypothetical protein